MILNFITSLIVSASLIFHPSPKDSVLPDIIILPQAQIKGYFLQYNDSSQTIKFYNITTNDTDIINLKNVKFFYYNSLPKSKYDTLYWSFHNFTVGKILFSNGDDIIFWDKKLSKIIVFYDLQFLNYNFTPLNKNIIFNPYLNLSFAVYSFIMSISLGLSKDWYSALIFLIFGAFALWEFFFNKTKIWKK